MWDLEKSQRKPFWERGRAGLERSRWKGWSGKYGEEIIWIWIWKKVYLYLNSNRTAQKRFERGWSGKYGETNCWKLFLVSILKVDLKEGLPSFKFKLISAKEIWDRDCMFWANTSLSPSWALFIQQFPLLLNRKPLGKHFLLLSMIVRAANSGGAEEEDARRGGGRRSECSGGCTCGQ